MDHIFTVPVRKTEIVVNGAKVQALEVDKGFWRAEPTADNLGTVVQEQVLVSNPLDEAFNAWNDIVPGDRVFLVLSEIDFSNPGLDDRGPSITENLARSS